MTWEQLIEAHLNVVSACESLGPSIAQTTKILRTSLDNHGKILLCGNGGSAAQAQHFAAELVGRFKTQREALPAIVLGTNPAITSALANDFGYPNVFVRELQALYDHEDVLIGITTSGKSANVLEALSYASDVGIETIALTGVHGVPGYLNVTQDIRVPSEDTARIQDVHQLILHALCEGLDA